MFSKEDLSNRVYALMKEVDDIRFNTARQSQVTLLAEQIDTIKEMLIEAGILVPVTEHTGKMYHVKGVLYHLKGKK